MSTNGPNPDLRSRISSAVEPIRQELRESLADLEKQITDAEAEIRDLKQLRRDAERYLQILDPSWEPERKKLGPSPKKKSKANISEEKVDAVEAWLRANMSDGQAFSVAAINKSRSQLGFDVVPPGTLAFAFAALHDRGSIRFDSIGPYQSKLYKLT